MSRHAPLRAAIATSVSVAVFLWWLAARRFLVSNDEGIFLDGALRILRGEVPYRDFFILMGPGTFWLEAAALKTFGVSLAASRIVTIADLSLIAGCVCWLVARWTNAGWAVWITLASFLLEIADPAMTLPNHRTDSAALAVATVTLLVARPGRVATIAAGVLAGFAAWTTPSVAILGIALLAWLMVTERARCLPFLLGYATVAAICGAVLQLQHALAPMLEQMVWTGRNYGGANFMWYGSRLGGYAALFEGASAEDLAPRILTVLALTTPAILPPLILPLSLTKTARFNRECLLVLTAAVALLLSAYPRFDVPHLTYSAPLFSALAGFHLSRVRPSLLRAAAFAIVCLLAAIPVSFSVYLRMHMVAIDSRVGKIVATPGDAEMIRGLEERTTRGERVFCFPYLPMFYFLTLGDNPTRFSYLQPGMMSDRDEMAVLTELQARPPEKIIYQDVSREMILRIWPNSDPNRLRLEKIETFVRCGYRPLVMVSCNGLPVQVLERAAR